MPLKKYVKATNERKRYSIDYSDWLAQHFLGDDDRSVQHNNPGGCGKRHNPLPTMTPVA